MGFPVKPGMTMVDGCEIGNNEGGDYTHPVRRTPLRHPERSACLPVGKEGSLCIDIF